MATMAKYKGAALLTLPVTQHNAKHNTETTNMRQHTEPSGNVAEIAAVHRWLLAVGGLAGCWMALLAGLLAWLVLSKCLQ